jgi:hypothetical protein
MQYYITKIRHPIYAWSLHTGSFVLSLEKEKKTTQHFPTHVVSTQDLNQQPGCCTLGGSLGQGPITQWDLNLYVGTMPFAWLLGHKFCSNPQCFVPLTSSKELIYVQKTTQICQNPKKPFFWISHQRSC